MEPATPNLGFPLIAAGQAQKHVTHNDALIQLDRLVQSKVIARTLSAPPATPVPGDSYIVAASPSGAWAGRAKDLAIYDTGIWVFSAATAGMRVYVLAEQALFAYTGSSWQQIAKVGPLDMLGINATADTVNRLAVSSSASLFNHAGSSHRMTVNKNASGDTASLVFCENLQGRAEIGTAGGSAFQIKVSPNGTLWKTGLSVSNPDGNIGVGIDQPTLGSTGRAIHIHAAAVDDWAISHYTTGPASGAGDGMIVGKIGLYNCVWNYSPSAIYFGTSATARMTISAAGQVGIGTTSPTTALDVAGPIRCGSSTVAALPPAPVSGAGASIYVSNESGGPVLAFSDGINWRRVTDRAVVS